MSHDRGCYCGNESGDYRACVAQKGKKCAKYYVVTELWDNKSASIDPLVTKACTFPENCTLNELKQAFRRAINDIQRNNIAHAIDKRHGLVHIPSRRMQLQKPRIRVVAGRAPWPAC